MSSLDPDPDEIIEEEDEDDIEDDNEEDDVDEEEIEVLEEEEEEDDESQPLLEHENEKITILELKTLNKRSDIFTWNEIRSRKGH